MSEPTVAYRGRVKYTEKTAREYQRRRQDKHRIEMRLIDRAFSFVPKSHRVLDIPCGGGRVALHLARKGYVVACADLSESMLTIARENAAREGVDCPVDRQDIERLTYANESFDAIVSFRLFHHFPNAEIRRRAVRELCRVAKCFVVLSYFSPVSFTSVKRRLQSALGGRKISKHATSRSEVQGYFDEAGFRFVKDFAEMPVIHTMHLAVFERRK
jgi:2-polyprenyl-3-methyl-5-hydroxy-6-metoxy-1,4-benzoquinol methylase